MFKILTTYICLKKIYKMQHLMGSGTPVLCIGARFLKVNPLNAKLNPICPLLPLLEAHHILHVNRKRVNP